MIRISDIKAAVCQVYDITPRELAGRTHRRAVTQPRQVGMYVARALTRHSPQRIGELFERDRTTVIYAIERIGRLYDVDPTVAAKAERVRHIVEARSTSTIINGAA